MNLASELCSAYISRYCQPDFNQILVHCLSLEQKIWSLYQCVTLIAMSFNEYCFFFQVDMQRRRWEDRNWPFLLQFDFGGEGVVARDWNGSTTQNIKMYECFNWPYRLRNGLKSWHTSLKRLLTTESRHGAAWLFLNERSEKRHLVTTNRFSIHDHE